MTSNVAVVIRFQCQTNYNATNVRCMFEYTRFPKCESRRFCYLQKVPLFIHNRR